MLSRTNNDAIDAAGNSSVNNTKVIIAQGKNGTIESVSRKKFHYKKILQLGIFWLGLFSGIECFAQTGAGPGLGNTGADNLEKIEETKAIKGKGWTLKSEGGLSYINPKDERFWFNIGATVRLDQIHYSGDVKDRRIEFANGGRIRRADINLDGGVGDHWEYSFDALFLGLGGSFNSSGGPSTRLNTASVVLQDVWLGYIGLFGKQSEIFLGRVSGNWYGLENAQGSTWMPFLERSAQANAFYPGDGIGVMVDKWWQDGGLTLIAIQPDQSRRIFVPTRPISSYNSDIWRVIGRLTYAPVHCLGDVWHFGVSGVWRQNKAALWGNIVRDVNPSAVPTDVVPRNAQFAAELLSTGNLSVSYTNQWAIEAARQCGPLLVGAEYAEFFVHRNFSPFGSLRFKGWDIYASYLLTGEAHKYDVRDGNFGSIDICSPYGAWEIAARYDYLNLNDKDIHGGSQDCYTVGLNWFINPVVRLSVDYVKCILRPSTMNIPFPADTRNIDVVAFRAQFRFK